MAYERLVSQPSAVSPRIGVEIEHFVFSSDRRAPSPTELATFFDVAVQNGCQSECDQEGVVRIVDCATSAGRARIGTDFCSHLLEIAFPPVSTIKQFRMVYHEVFVLLRKSLTAAQLNIQFGGFLSDLPNALAFSRNIDPNVQRRWEWLQNRIIPNYEHSCKWFNARIAATHVHLGIDPAIVLPSLQALYRVEYIVPLLFSNSSTPYGVHCVRPLVWRDAFEENSLNSSWPTILPDSMTEHTDRISRAGFGKDYSFIAPRPDLGTIEFRSACSQDNVDRICELIAFRIAALRMALSQAPDPIERSYSASREAFYGVCGSPEVDPQTLLEDLSMLTGRVSSCCEIYDSFRSFAARGSSSHRSAPPELETPVETVNAG